MNLSNIYCKIILNVYTVINNLNSSQVMSFKFSSLNSEFNSKQHFLLLWRSVFKIPVIKLHMIFYNFQDMTVVLDKRGPSPAEIQPRPISESRLSPKVVTVFTNRAGIRTKNPKSLRRQSHSHSVSGSIFTLL